MVPLRDFEDLLQTLMAFDAVAKTHNKNHGKNVTR
jgi:hypothetical protein